MFHNVSVECKLTVLPLGHKADRFADCLDIDFEMVGIVLYCVVHKVAAQVLRMVELDIDLDKDLKRNKKSL